MRTVPGHLRATAPRVVVGLVLAGAQVLVLLGSLVVGPCWEGWTYGAAVILAFAALVLVVWLSVRGRFVLAALTVALSAGVSTVLFLVDDLMINASACR
ncbi:MAG TPA: hypothetical protein VFL69_08650 [Marmoricola sp.]|nr:hypothetical protein [Marmoricola sp.]